MIALPVCEAVLAHRKGEYGRALDLMRPVLGGMYQLGGSHAQQDVLFQLFADAAVKADCADDVRLVVKRAGRDDLADTRRLCCGRALRTLIGETDMAMTMSGEIQLPASREVVWQKLNDPEVLKATIPGCESLEKTSDTSFPPSRSPRSAR